MTRNSLRVSLALPLSELAQNVFDLDQRRLALKRRYDDRFKAALSPILGVRFFQIENQLEKLVDLQIASNRSIVEEGPPR